MVRYQITFGHGEEAVTLIRKGKSLYQILSSLYAKENLDMNDVTNLQKIF